MRSNVIQATRRPIRYSFITAGIAAGIALLAVMAVFVIRQSTAQAQTATVNLGAASNFAVLAGSTVTNTGPTVVTGDLGVSPGSAVTGFPPGVVVGTIHAADAAAAAAQVALTAAFNDAATRAPATPIPADIGGLVLTPGVYRAASSLGITGTVTLNGQGDPNAVFIIQVPTALTTASASVVSLINGTSPCNVFFVVGSSATLGTGSTFAGNILAQASITATTGVNVTGRLLARTAAVTLDTNLVTRPLCPIVVPTPNPTDTANAANDEDGPDTRAINQSNNHVGLKVNQHGNGESLTRTSDRHRSGARSRSRSHSRSTSR
ncbi:MAG TPA: ice-binding family protein [Kribbella sp.]